MSNSDLVPLQPGALARAGQIANEIAGAGVFEDYRSRKAFNTLDRQNNDLVLFGAFLRETGLDPGDFATDPGAWRGVTWGIVEGFKRWMLAESYAWGSVNATLSTIKVYASLAAKAGAIESNELTLIKTVKGYPRKEARNLDEQRAAQGQPVRRQVRRTGVKTHKKAQSVIIGQLQAEELKAQPETPQGLRDRLIICLLLDHGLRVGELAGLGVDCFDMAAGELYFYRPKVYKYQRLTLSEDTLAAARAYLPMAPSSSGIWRGSRKNGELTESKLGIRAITARVKLLGAAAGIPGLSPHDCRHTWATRAARAGTPLERLKDAGGWASLAMAERYIAEARLSNQGVLL